MTFQQWLKSLNGKTAAVVGIGVSNTPLIRLLADHGVSVTACDRTERERYHDPALLAELEARGVCLRMGEDYLDNLTQHYIFRSPGIRPDIPAFEAARLRGCEVTSEMEVFFDLCPCKIIAVTGSDGKTTTTTIIARLLEAADYTVHLGGNIGHPLLSETGEMDKDDIAVLELSSFQLMTMRTSPDIAVITNLSPNHLNWHVDMAEYVSAKENILRWQSRDSKTVLNHDNAPSVALAKKVRGKLVWFARETEIDTGVTIEDGSIVVKGDRAVLPLADIRLPGVHNWENYMAAIAAVDGLVPDDIIRDFARSFSGVEHRIELIRELDGVRYYNDSIASSPNRTTAGLRSFPERVILIAGGQDKHLDYAPLGPELVEHCKALVLTGETAGKIRAAAEQAPGYDPEKLPIYDVEGFRDAAERARALAQPGDVVILSPASTSFDRFRNFMERGDTFKAIVNSFES